VKADYAIVSQDDGYHYQTGGDAGEGMAEKEHPQVVSRVPVEPQLRAAARAVVSHDSGHAVARILLFYR